MLNKLDFLVRQSTRLVFITFKKKQIPCACKQFSFITSNMTGTKESPPKKPHLSKKIGTHNGKFHCDEALACFMLKLLDEYKDAEIIRTRDQAILDTCDIVVDVGGTYDPSKHRYDHHQRTFNESMNSLCPEKKWVTKLSSAGLVYFHFGVEIIAKQLNLPADDHITKVIFDKVYENFMEEIDAIDNGINQAEGELRYQITTNLSSRVNILNPGWNEKDVDVQLQFDKAMKLVGEEFMERITYYQNGWLPAREFVAEAVKNRFEVDSSGRIIYLKEGGVPWKDHLYTLEEEQNLSPLLVYVLFADQNNGWRVQCVSKKLGSFENRLSLPEEWRGLRDEELSEKSGIPGCIFVHASGFIGGNKTFEGVLEMARKSLD
ncbi:UPF0160 protein MYG1 mitochondrial-like isoform X1 [Biomphalaria pfeifferi]|uniref:UPF0160 protein MYG1 mitochondrial-like isoform X1 n=1 Tax=Biomphalaria pfeifferi TaxID=112525 RepID=A0AAD8B782_BIOPF|nr:UPF0160 protein MYG1 mitochondrial-like isoform X1 [Biomphalaria pfeifferi]